MDDCHTTTTSVVGMVLGDEVLRVHLLEENRAMCSDNSLLLLWGHCGFESGGMTMEVHNCYIFNKFLSKILIGDNESLF